MGERRGKKWSSLAIFMQNGLSDRYTPKPVRFLQKKNNKSSICSLFLHNETYIEEKTKYDYVYLASITKFVVMLGFLHCIRNHHLRVTSKVKKVFPEFEHDYTFQDIINHRTALANDWLGSQLNKKYSKSNNIYEFFVPSSPPTPLHPTFLQNEPLSGGTFVLHGKTTCRMFIKRHAVVSLPPCGSEERPPRQNPPPALFPLSTPRFSKTSRYQAAHL